MTIKLRILTESDIDTRYVSWLNDPRTRQFLGVRHKNGQITLSECQRFLADTMSSHRYHWGICADDKHIGNVSCSAWSKADRWVDISYLIGDPSFSGKGIASLAVGAAINYLFVNAGFHRVQAESSVENEASIRVMKRLGMRQEAVFREKLYMPDEDRFVDEALFSVLKQDWIIPLPDINHVVVQAMPWETNTKS